MFHGNKEADMLEPDADMLALALQFVGDRDAKKVLDESVKAQKVRLKQIIGDATGIKLPGGYLSYFAAKPKRKEVTDWEKVARTLLSSLRGRLDMEDDEVAQAFDEVINTHTKVFDGFGPRALRVKLKKEKQ
jgi:hypothetical protein